MYRAHHTHTGAIHVPHDSLRRSLARRSCDRCLLELGYRADRGPEVHCEFTERVAVVRVDGLYQS